MRAVSITTVADQPRTPEQAWAGWRSPPVAAHFEDGAVAGPTAMGLRATSHVKAKRELLVIVLVFIQKTPAPMLDMASNEPRRCGDGTKK
jgi:hypothetical protein